MEPLLTKAKSKRFISPSHAAHSVHWQEKGAAEVASLLQAPLQTQVEVNLEEATDMSPATAATTKDAQQAQIEVHVEQRANTPAAPGVTANDAHAGAQLLEVKQP